MHEKLIPEVRAVRHADAGSRRDGSVGAGGWQNQGRLDEVIGRKPYSLEQQPFANRKPFQPGERDPVAQRGDAVTQSDASRATATRSVNRPQFSFFADHGGTMPLVRA